LAQSKAIGKGMRRRLMTRSELIERMAQRHGARLAVGDVEKAVKNIVEQMSSALARGDRIEIRGFGSLSVRCRRPRRGRNPGTGEALDVPGRHVAHFKPGKRLRDRVDAGRPCSGGRASERRTAGADPLKGLEDQPPVETGR